MKLLARNYNLVVQTANDETLVYDLNTDKAYLLNETSTFVWQLCDGRNSAADISRQLARRFKQTENEDIVWLAIDGLKTNNLLDEAAEIAIPFAAQSRREVIKKVGLATMLALPVIVGLTAPQAAHAASVRDLANCAACDPNNNRCISGNCTVNASSNNPPNICSAGTSNGSFTSGTSFGANNAAECNTNAAQSCCSGNSSGFNPATSNCTCA